GTVQASVFTNNGILAPGASPGILSVTGPLAQTSSSIINIEIGGPTVGADYDQLKVSGAFTRNGTLNVSLINGYVPAVNDTFAIATFASTAGGFTSTVVPGNDAQLTIAFSTGHAVDTMYAVVTGTLP